MSLEQKDIPNYLNSTRLIVLSTIGPQGGPAIRSLGAFATDGLTVYFSTSKSSDKVQQIGKNPKVSILFQHESQELPSFSNVEIRGRAELLDKEERSRAISLIAARNPRFKERAEKGELADAALLRVTPEAVKVVDLSKGRGASTVTNIQL